MKIAVIGATGLVGSMMLRILEERSFPVSQLYCAASEKSAGKTIFFKSEKYPIISVEEALKMSPDIVLFSAGASVALEWAPRFASAGTTVIDNSSCWRMEADVPLVVPEINGEVLTEKDKIIANPNCSTIQMVMVLNPLHLRYKIHRVVVSTYQSVSGTGAKAVQQLMNERAGKNGTMAYPYTIDLNCLPHVDLFLDNGYTKEEMKMVNETRKIMREPSLQISPTAVRIPVKGGHSESVNIQFENGFELSDVYEILAHSYGIVVQDDPSMNKYPMPLLSEGKDEVFVGRIRRDLSQKNTLSCWIVADNLRKGAATNAVQIAELLIRRKFFG